MHSAPAVRYPVALSQWVVLSVASLWVIAATLCGWWYATDAGNPWFLWGLSCLLVSGSAAALLLRAAPQGTLRWDGQAWWWTGEVDIQVTVALQFDLQHLLVLRISGLPGRDPWCCVDRSASPRAWGELRRALYASTPSPGAPAATKGSAP